MANLMVAGAAMADDHGPRSSNGEFLWTAYRSAMAEHRLAKLASFHSSNEGVKVFANKLAKDQAKTVHSLRFLAMQKGIKLPDDINYDQQAQIDRLNQLSDNDFDRFFVDEAMKDNDAILAYLQSEASTNKDSDIRNWANAEIAEVNHHLRMAEAIDVRIASLSSPW
jgi:putative membrane protein